jgi:hypothetical protein
MGPTRLAILPGWSRAIWSEFGGVIGLIEGDDNVACFSVSDRHRVM